MVPADRKWYRDWAVANVLLAHLDELRLGYPEVKLDLPGLRQRLADPGRHRGQQGRVDLGIGLGLVAGALGDPR